MRKTDCNICDRKEIPQNEIINVDKQTYCTTCFETYFPDQKNLDNKSVEKEFDPTICSSCEKDFGDTELKKISNYPICSECEIIIKNKAFPTWVKGFFIGILVVVVGSFIWNWKFYTAYRNVLKSKEYFEKGDFVNAASVLKSANEKVPGVPDLQLQSIYSNGLAFLSQDKSSKALAEFEKCRDKLPPEYEVEKLIIQARIGSTFDNKDYRGFLEAANENAAMDPKSAISWTSVASAYACIYADEGKEEDKLNSIKFLNEAKQLDSTSQEMKIYYNMVEYRLDSRKIIRREEFIKQFPNGWTK